MSRRSSSPMPLVRTGVRKSGTSLLPVVGKLGAQPGLAQQAFVGTLFVLRLADDEVEHHDPAGIADAAGIVGVGDAARAGRLEAGILLDLPGAIRLDGLDERSGLVAAGANRRDHGVDLLARKVVDELEVDLRARRAIAR